MSTTPPLPTLDKLTFTLSSDGTYYSVKALNTSISGEVVIPAEYNGKPVKEIEKDAFFYCTSLTSVTIGNGVTSIGRFAFCACEALTSVTIGNGVTSIGDQAFQDCLALTSITIPSSVTSIGYQTFGNCKSLTSVTIPDNVTSIAEGAFYGCSSVTTITVDPANTGYKSDGNCLIEKATNKLITGCKTSIIPNYVTSIGNHAFYGCLFTSITIPNSVTSIGESAFSYCSALTTVIIGNGVTSIGDHTFANCDKLTSITIPNSVTSIESWAFRYCSSLKTVIIKGKPTVPTNTYNAFGNTPKLEKIYVIDGQGYSPGDTINGKPIEILPAEPAVVAKTMSVKSMTIS